MTADDGAEPPAGSPEQPLLDEMASLTSTSRSTEVNQLIYDLAAAELGPIADVIVLADVKRRTKLPIGDLKRALSTAKRELQPDGEAAAASGKQADILVALAGNADLFHAPDGTAYADVRVANHRETWQIKSRGFRR
jgi:hypothetical protein